ncbi:hypothetical protein WOLCODRAFT_136971 [Wolfiporia cocos MD-104 SS10]|uniref:Thioesterase domain-containing protein n=1 Tax=Wolfiporia cocos (strain MD-104) TaxID=742152 RepID=A0A2H3JLL9_WOLCO|nr:hypothetical protein WOLCODRAFT_136971 [Wolfiporia cocos MD-104 SS10]
MTAERVQHWTNAMQDARGNVPTELKDKLIRLVAIFTREGDFGDSVVLGLKATELSLFERPEDGSTQARVVFELTVTRDMVNTHDMLHGGCSAFIVDTCSSIALALAGYAKGGNVDLVSQALNTNYFAGASLGDKLEIVNVTLATGSRTSTARTEIWDTTTRRLCASGTHVKMRPAASNLKL